MNHTAILNLTTDLGYKGFKEAYMRQIEDIAYHSLGFEERLYQLLQAQDVFLNNKRVSMNLKLSKIKNKQALLEELDYDPKRKINKAQILSLASMDFIRARQNIIINGKTGTGKTFTVAQLVTKLQAQHDKQRLRDKKLPPLSISLTAPTGKAAQRMQTSLQNSLHDQNIAGPVVFHRLIGVPDTCIVMI